MGTCRNALCVWVFCIILNKCSQIQPFWGILHWILAPKGTLSCWRPFSSDQTNIIIILIFFNLLQNSTQVNETKPERQYPANRNRPIIKQQQQHPNQEPLLSRRQPQIMPAAKKQQYYPNQPQHLQQPFLQQNQFVQVITHCKKFSDVMGFDLDVIDTSNNHSCSKISLFISMNTI